MVITNCDNPVNYLRLCKVFCKKMILREKINTVTGVATNIVVKLRAMLVCTVSNKSFATRQPSFF